MEAADATLNRIERDRGWWGHHLDILASALTATAVFESAVVLAALDATLAAGPINAVRLDADHGKRALTTVLTVAHSKGDVVVSTWGLVRPSDRSKIVSALKTQPDLWVLPCASPLSDTASLFEVRRGLVGTATPPPNHIVLERALLKEGQRLQVTSVAFPDRESGGSLAHLVRS